MDVNHCVLLTGAGFTRNFGAPLAADVWALLFSHPDIRKHEPVHRLFKDNLDFEEVYHAVLSGNYNNHQRAAVLKATRDVYEYIDTIVCRYRLDSSAPNHLGVQNLLSSFRGTTGRPGFIFTLNQDLFVERYFNHMRPFMPYLGTPPTWSHDSPFFDRQIVLPDFGNLEMPSLSDSTLYYIKLHGSCNWYSESGSDIMVIGREKEAAIAGNALLRLYASIFRKVLTEGAARVLCIGYGFRDKHVNDALADGARAGLRVLILGPGSPREGRTHILEQHRGPEIWEATDGYFPFDLGRLFPPGGGSETPEWRVVSTQLSGSGGK